MPPLKRLWLWLTTCVEAGCSNRAVGWCSEHPPAEDPQADDWWGNPGSDRR
jgi:hypothetical protein